MKYWISICRILLLILLLNSAKANHIQNSISWNSVSANPVSVACSNGEVLSISFNIASNAVLDLEVQLAAGMKYVTSTAALASGGTLVSVNSANLNKPIFTINANASTTIVLNFTRKSTCASRVGQISGNTFEDEAKIFISGSQVGTAKKSNAYQINYAALSITSSSTSPSTANVGNVITRSATISNGSFGYLSSFTFQDSRPSNTISIQTVNVIEGANTYPVSLANITNTGTVLTVNIDAAMLSNIGNKNNQFDLNESITIRYTIKVLSCYQGSGTSSSLSTFWGCDNETCQTNSAPASFNISNGVPSLSLTTISEPNIDFCNAVTYSTKLKNNSTAAKDFARDVAIICGLRSNDSPIATPTVNTMWSGLQQGVKIFSNFKLNGISVTLPTLNKNGPVHYVAYNYFTTDPDGVGGLADIDGDGFYDDLAPGQELTISFDITITPKSVACSNVNYGNYIMWEHISADASWHNQCGTQMQPVRDEFNYVNFIRNYLNPTPVAATPNIEDGIPFTVSIKPHIYAGLNCNGQSSGTGNGVNFHVALILPPGVSLSPTATTDSYFSTFSPSLYQSNDTVYYKINKVSYNWFNIKLVMDCNLWPGTSQYATFRFITHYSCKQGTNVCFEKDIHCETVLSLPQCAGNCKGPATKYFSTKRVNPGWSNNTKTALSTNHAASYAEPYDTVRFTSMAVIQDTTVNNLKFKTTYSSHSANNLFNYRSGTITIYDIDGQFGQSSYTFPIVTPPTVTNLGSNIYEVSLDLTPFQAKINAGYQYGKGNGTPNDYDADSIKVILDFVINPAVPTSTLNTVNNFQGYFSFTNNNIEQICNKYGSALSYGRGYLSFGASADNHSNCGGTFTKHWANNNDVSGIFTQEYRPHYHADSITFAMPTGMNFVDVERFGPNIYSHYAFASVDANNKLTFTRPTAYKDPNNDGTFYPSIVVRYLADCRLPAGNISIPTRFYVKEFAYLLNPASHIPQNLNSTMNILYTPPNFTINTGQKKKITLTNQVRWEMEVCNTTPSANITYNWLLIDDRGGQVNITGASDITGTAIPLTLVNNGNGQILVQFGLLNANSCKKIRIEATYTGCSADTISVKHGWSCFAYPTVNQLYACGTEYLYEVVPQVAQLSMSVTPLATTPSNPANASSTDFGQSTVDMCSPFPVEVTFTSAQLGYLYDVSSIMNNPISGGGSALGFVSGSGYIEYPEGTTPRPFSVAANTALLAANANTTMPFDLSQIDPTNFNHLPFKGVGTPDSNKVILRFKLQSNCLLNSGDILSFESKAISNCGEDAFGSGELISAYNLNVTGVTTPYSANFTNLTMPNIYNCSQNATINVALTKVGTVPVASSDKIVIVLPQDVTYNSLIGCSTGICIDPNQLTITTVGNNKILNFKMPAMNNGDNLAFSLSVTYNTTTHGCSENTELLSAKVVTGATIFCTQTGANCPNSGVAVGQISKAINFYKPEITLSNLQLTDYSYGATPQLYSFSLNIENTSNQNTTAPIIIDFYCADNAGNPTGGVLHSINTGTILTSGQSMALQGSFSNTCNPTNGVVVQVTQQAANNTNQCICANEIIRGLRKPVNRILGEIFFDANLNTINELENAGNLANGIIVRLQDNTGSPILNSNNIPVIYTVGTNGLFNFQNLPTGTYKIVLDQTSTPTGFEGVTPYQRTIPLGVGQIAASQDLAIQTCQLSISNVAFIRPTCFNPLGGQITITANSYSTPTYRISYSPSHQTNNVFSNLGVGQYAIEVKNSAGCTATYPTPIAFDLPSCIEICNNGTDDDGDGLIDCDDPDCAYSGNANTIINH
jgi:large repetitive protein